MSGEVVGGGAEWVPTLDLLRDLDFDGLSKDELLEVISALDRVVSWVADRSHDAVLAFAGEASTRPVPTPDPGTPAGRYSMWEQGWETEILAERLRLSYPTVQARIAHARVLHASMPLTLAGSTRRVVDAVPVGAAAARDRGTGTAGADPDRG